ncbi:hypothetical protein EBU99_12185 [bacterium]|nr:hypothetical protein [bacterium]
MMINTIKSTAFRSLILTTLVFSQACTAGQTENNLPRTSKFATKSEKDTEQNTNSLLWFVDKPQAQAVWSPFGVSHPGAQSFEAWVKKANNARSIPEFTNMLSLNCWEYVLYTAVRLGNLEVATVKALYEKKRDGQKLSEILGTTIGKANYKIKNNSVKLNWPLGIKPGDVVFMDETGHVVQLSGLQNDHSENLVISFSPRPIWGDGSREAPEPSLRPELTTIESLLEEMIELYPDVPTDWENIELKIIRPFQKMNK